ncbi:DUF5025 domain-containing protein [Sphingobacterium deserti]|uniref:Uncharacterized protein n=1 Tax=Sphingobacterium deserti TaxID=1229276 RepID=A0A0B8T332_9SPHI|nr:DUF5025 domain-containing protein [Sphingobacterium deserti]KGE15852.1 hypothetical protein DI53_0405 [Sphingobacterium deserti]
MKTLYILLCSFSLSIMEGCSKNNVEIPPVEFGKIDARFGRHGYTLMNDHSRKVINTLTYDGKNYRFYIELNNFGNNGFQDYRVFHRLEVDLEDIVAGKVYSFDATNSSTERQQKNRISYEYIEAIGDRFDHKFYRPAIGKRNLSLTIESIKSNNYRTPAIDGGFEGYLFNVADVRDSVLISARFLTEAVR